MPHESDINLEDGVSVGEVLELFGDTLEQMVMHRWERKAFAVGAIAATAGQIARYKGRKEVQNTYQHGSHDEFVELQDECQEYVEQYFDAFQRGGQLYTTAIHNFPPKRSIEFWEHIGHVEGLQDIGFNETPERLYGEKLGEIPHLTAEGIDTEQYTSDNLSPYAENASDAVYATQ